MFRHKRYIPNKSLDYIEKFDIIITPLLQKKLENLSKDHIKIIWDKIKKLKEHGLNAVKVLFILDRYLLCEIKLHRPPYRLYVIFNQEKKTFYIVDWEHKEKQEKIINKLKEKIKEAIKEGTDLLFFFK